MTRYVWRDRTDRLDDGRRSGRAHRSRHPEVRRPDDL